MRGAAVKMVEKGMARIRAYRNEDEDAVIALWRACEMLRWSDPRKDIARKLKVNPEWFLVAEAEETETAADAETTAREIVGTCMVGYEGHRGWINFLAVAPEVQGGGVGKALMAEAERLLREVGCAKINLQVRASNRKVVAFYERLGFASEELLSMGKRLVKE